MRGKDQRREARTAIAARTRSARAIPVGRSEQRSARTSYAYAGRTICGEVPWRCRKPGDGSGFGEIVSDTHILIPYSTNDCPAAQPRLPGAPPLKTSKYH